MNLNFCAICLPEGNITHEVHIMFPKGTHHSTKTGNPALWQGFCFGGNEGALNPAARSAASRCTFKIIVIKSLAS